MTSKTEIIENVDDKKIYCTRCDGYRHCKVLGAVEHSYDNYEEYEYRCGVDGWDKYYIVECNGCGYIFFAIESYFSEKEYHEENKIDVAIYPKNKFKPKSCIEEVLWSESSGTLYNEIYSGLNNGLYSIVIMGLRTFTEQFMVHVNKEDKKNFQENIKNSIKKNIFTQDQANYLIDVTKFGNDVVHRKSQPNEKQVIIALDIVESAIEISLVNKTKANTLKKL